MEHVCSSIQVKALGTKCTIRRWGACLNPSKVESRAVTIVMTADINSTETQWLISSPPRRDSYCCPSKDLFFPPREWYSDLWGTEKENKFSWRHQLTKWRDPWQREMSSLLAVLLWAFWYRFNNKIRNRTDFPWEGIWQLGEWAEPSAMDKERGITLQFPRLSVLQWLQKLKEAETNECMSVTGLASTDEGRWLPAHLFIQGSQWRWGNQNLSLIPGFLDPFFCVTQLML